MQGVSGGIRRRLLMRAAVIAGQTELAAAELTVAFNGAPTRVVPNPVIGVDAPPLSGLQRVSFAGRLSEEKDLVRLLRAWETVATERPDASLVLIGAGGAFRSCEADLRAQVARSAVLRSSVRFTGWLADPSSEVLAADVFVFPSLSEGMSNSLLEACAAGRVVVASDIAANRAVLGDDYPLLFAAGEEAGMVRKLSAALDDEPLRARARELVLKRAQMFAPDKVAEHLERLLNADSARHQ